MNGQSLKAYKNRLSRAIRTANICVFEVDITRQLYTYFENSEAIYGVPGEKILEDVRPMAALPPEEYQRRVTEYFVHPDDEGAVRTAFQSVFAGKTASYEARMRAGGGAYVWCKVDVAPAVEEDGTVRMLGVIMDIQSLKRRIELLEEFSRLDTFTSLYSKRSFEEMCKSLMKENPKERMALLIMDLDAFKSVNDRYGHQAGDRVILSVAAHLQEFFSDGHLTARFGGDEFMVLLRDVSGVEAVEETIGRFQVETDNDLGVTKSVGYAVFPDHADNYEELFFYADHALYEAKKRRRENGADQQ